MPKPTGWPEVTRLIPHRPPILMIEEIVEHRQKELICRGVLPAPSPFLALELAAQTTAAMAALEDGALLAEGPPKEPPVGYLAAIHDARFLVPEIPEGRKVLATVRKTRSLPPLSRYSVIVTLEEGSIDLIRATLSTYRATSRR